MSKNNRDFTHIILTRFNVSIDYAPTVKGLDPVWLRERLELFNRYCVPSVMNQGNAQFEWFVFCNAESPLWFKETMEAYGKPLTVIYIQGPATDQIIAQKVRESGRVTTPYLITTRIDNDDAMARGHLSRIQAAFDRQEREFVTFRFGLQLYRGHLYHMYCTNSPFLSLVEKVGADHSFTTVLCVPHPEVHKAGRVRKLWSGPQWLQVLHGGNVGNALRGWPCISSRESRRFDIVWPEERCQDTFARRMAFSLEVRAKRAQRAVARLRVVTKADAVQAPGKITN